MMRQRRTVSLASVKGSQTPHRSVTRGADFARTADVPGRQRTESVVACGQGPGRGSRVRQHGRSSRVTSRSPPERGGVSVPAALEKRRWHPLAWP